jgi:hypothetical protein
VCVCVCVCVGSTRPNALRPVAAVQGKRVGQRRGLAVVRVRAEEQDDADSRIEALEGKLGSRKGGKGGGVKNMNKVSASASHAPCSAALHWQQPPWAPPAC